MWSTYLINMPANTERLRNSEAQFVDLGIKFERINAVDGRMLSEQDIQNVYDAEANRYRARNPLVASEIGCYLSHIEAWKKISQGNFKGGFIFEDDFRASDNLGILMELLSEDTDSWDIVKLFSLKTNLKCIARRPLGKDHSIATPYKVPNGTIGYGIRKSAAKRLLDCSIPFFRPIDEDHKFFWEKGLRVALVLPPPLTIGDEQTATGTIQDDRRTTKPTRFTKKLHQGIRNLLYQIRYKALLHWHRR
ncbi:MAG: glycosyltransferase family 25 protein [Gammaproteobacteria bacterium]|nr:glycosyltransferase family 25 protein [Gammaproteobacteria bacterium]